MPKLPGMGATGVAETGTAGIEETGVVGTAETGTEGAAGIGARLLQLLAPQKFLQVGK